MWDGALYRHTNELGVVATNTWDALRRLTGTAFPDGHTTNSYSTATFTNRPLHLLRTKEKVVNWTYFGYNAIGVLEKVTNAQG